MKRFFQLLGLGCLVLVTAACAARNSDRADLSFIEVEKIPTSIVSVSRADVYQKGGNLIVSGTLRRTHEVKAPGHLDILICGPDGLIAKQSVTVPGLSSKRRGALNLPCRANFGLVPPAGTRILLRYHAPTGKPLTGPICAENHPKDRERAAGASSHERFS